MDGGTLNRFERRKLRTRKKLKDSALELILEKGYQDVTIQDITDRADLGRATFYLHYKDKDEILWDFIEEGLNDFFDRARALRDDHHGDKPLLYYSLLLDFQMLDQNRDLYKIIMGDIGPEQVRRRAKELTAADVEQGIREGRFFQKIDLPPAVLAQFVTGALHQLFQWWLEVPNEYTPKQMVDMIFRMFAGLI